MAAAPEPESAPRRGSRLAFIGRWAVLAMIVALVVAAREMHAAGLLDPATIRAFIDDRPLLTAGCFVLIYGACVMSFIPTLPLNLAAGFLWGWQAGGLLATLGVTLGALAAFVAARFVLGPATIARLSALLPFDLGRTIDRLGWRAVAFFRLNPAFPTSVINYALGVTSLSLATYCWSTFVFLLPATFAIALAGEKTQALILAGSAADLVNALAVILAVATTLAAVAWIMRPPRNGKPNE
jgi:uncharacterized membrane protein YdjX (TVP38/TMEM64 family)